MVIFVINNNGYTVERAIHGPKMHYNDIQKWDYLSLPKIFGKSWSTKVHNEIELEEALKNLYNHSDKLRLIEVVMDQEDVPELLAKIAKNINGDNQY